ncbi:MAG: hypothetical protein ACREMR_08055 [Gemmatimonadales bacterium]
MVRTATDKLALAVLLAALGCGDTSGPAPGTPRIDYVDGAIAPVLVRGQAFVVEGFGFGDLPGTVQFPAAGGGETPGPVDSITWSDLSVRATVPDGAVAGTLAVVTTTGRRLTAAVRVLPRVDFDPATLSWSARFDFPRSPVGVALAVAEYPGAGGTLGATIYAAGGAEPIGGDSVMAPDSGIHIARAAPGGALESWQRQPDNAALPVRRAFAAAAVATRYNSPSTGGVLYVIGGVDAAGRAQAGVLGATVTADAVAGPFVPLVPLPEPVAGASAVVKRGRIYLIGGTDSVGRPLRRVLVARVRSDGRLDGWYAQPTLPLPRVYGGAVVLDERVVAFGGVADSVPPGGGLDPTPTRLVTGDTAALSLFSGFFTSAWGAGAPPLPEGRSQFATLDLGNVVLAVGGMYGGAATNSAETIAAAVAGDSLGAFAGPVGLSTIAGLGGGTLVVPAGATWREADGGRHGVVIGGMDLITRQRRAGSWGF